MKAKQAQARKVKTITARVNCATSGRIELANFAPKLNGFRCCKCNSMNHTVAAVK